MALFSVLLPREIIIMDKQNMVLAIRALADWLRYSAKILFSTNSNAFDSFFLLLLLFLHLSTMHPTSL